MQRLLGGSFFLLVGVVVAAAVPISTFATSGVRECGNAGTLYRGEVRLTNVTSRNVVCSEARRFARSFHLKGGQESDYTCSEDFYCTFRGYQCRNDGRSAKYIDHRCEKPSPTRTYVVRWQAG
jgi:hypothetical protein